MTTFISNLLRTFLSFRLVTLFNYLLAFFVCFILHSIISLFSSDIPFAFFMTIVLVDSIISIGFLFLLSFFSYVLFQFGVFK